MCVSAIKFTLKLPVDDEIEVGIVVPQYLLVVVPSEIVTLSQLGMEKKHTEQIGFMTIITNWIL